MKCFTRVVIKRARRVHPEWTPEQLLAHAQSVCDQAGMYPDTVTLQDVVDVLAAMDERSER